jgi:hypothetical protein
LKDLREGNCLDLLGKSLRIYLRIYLLFYFLISDNINPNDDRTEHPVGNLLAPANAGLQGLARRPFSGI